MLRAESLQVRWRPKLLLVAGAGLASGVAAFVGMILLARAMPDAPPYLLLEAPSEVVRWVVLDRLLFALVCLGLLVAGAAAGAAARAHRAVVTVLSVGSCICVLGLLMQGLLWGTDETAQDLGLSVTWLDTASLIATAATVLAGLAVVSGGLRLAMLAGRPFTATP